jgi:photoactive yellow protein
MTIATLTAPSVAHGFDDAGLPAWLDGAAPDALDALPFGTVGLDADCAVQAYNATEARLAGLSGDRVLGRHFFHDVAPCMNNHLVAERLADTGELDETIPYVLTFRMRPTPVRLRLVRRAGAALSWILICRARPGG